jgi:hypothetical protein
MGNRANVIFVAGETISPTVYLHWNGGPESVYPFLAELDRRKVRADGEYECARFIQLVGEFFDHDEFSGLSLGVLAPPTAISLDALAKVQTDQGNNGFYIVDRSGGKLKVRRFQRQYSPAPDYKNLGLKEMSPREVLAEERKAWKHDYNVKGETFAKTFLKIQGKRKLPNE